MVFINYQFYGNEGFHLRLRLYKDQETRFINVTKLLKGAIQKRHWSQKRQMFLPSCPFADENNEILVQFRQKYDMVAVNWTGSLYGFMTYMEEQKSSSKGIPTVSEYINVIADRLRQLKHEDGTGKGSFYNYLKLDKRLKEYCDIYGIRYDKFLITEVTASFVDNVLDWIINYRQSKGLGYISKNFHSVIMKAEKDGYLEFEDFKNCNWVKFKRGSTQKYFTLNEYQCTKFVNTKLEDLPQTPNVGLLRDFCVFLLYTGHSACDIASMKKTNIKVIEGVEHFVFKRRKISEKQVVPCCVPINVELQKIINRWKGLSKNGYILPIRQLDKTKSPYTNDLDIKLFLSKVNRWLKDVGDMLGCSFPLHSYVFRHTAITRYISKGIPALYVANMMGTSVENCETIYYNNHADVSSRNMVMDAMKF